MAEIEEPQFTSLQQRIAALNQSQSNQHQTFGKRPPPPIPTSSNRPAAPTRIQTTNNPPIATYGSSVTKQPNNLPNGTLVKNVLPPPPVDRDFPQNNAKTPPLPARKAPPPLPGRDAPPPLPGRKASSQLNTSTQLARKTSNSSISSSISGLSLTHTRTGSSVTSTASVDTQRKLPPALGDAKLPPLPPTKREREETARIEEQARAAEALYSEKKAPLLSTKSAPNVLRPPVVDRDVAPRMPPRPSGSPRMPSRTGEDVPPPQPPRRPVEDVPPAQPPRKLPPPAARSILSMGFNNKRETPNPGPLPTPTISRSAPRPSPQAITELTEQNLDSFIKKGHFVFVKLYSPHCYNCQMMQPQWEEIGKDFGLVPNKLVIAQLDTFKLPRINGRFKLSMYPTLLLFDGRNVTTPKRFCDGGIPELEDIVEFLERETGVKRGEAGEAVPPPINLSSKPAPHQVKAIQSRPPPAAPTSGCLICRDYSEPDRVAAQYPRESLPRNGDMTAYLAEVLCGPFTSLTDKARAIFTWQHHNIAYDVASFFGNNVKHVDPRDTIRTGLAVCGGYAGLYVAIALKAGMECVMVTGHGKGYGYTPLKPGERCPPPDPSGHAWNAVRIDGGEWKLLDACWGAGNVGNQQFNKVFTPSYFTMPNDEFGLKHFPQDEEYFFRSDGRPQTWEDYFIGPIGEEPLTLCGTVDELGLSKTSFSPPQKRISVHSNEVIRFQFSKACEHWDHIKNGGGKPYCMVLIFHKPDGSHEFAPFENNDFWWWLDVKARDLGSPGKTITCGYLSEVNGKKDVARGITREHYLTRIKGKSGFNTGGVAMWELV